MVRAEAATVGRKDILQRLRAAAVRATSGRGGAVSLIGEPGIRKTHLAEVIEREARTHGVRSAWGRLQAEEGLPPLWPFAQVISELTQNAQPDEVLRSLTGSAMAQGCDAAVPTEELSFSDTSTSIRAIQTIVQAIRFACQTQPLLLFFDDLQWADAATLRTHGSSDG